MRSESEARPDLERLTAAAGDAIERLRAALPRLRTEAGILDALAAHATATAALARIAPELDAFRLAFPDAPPEAGDGA